MMYLPPAGHVGLTGMYRVGPNKSASVGVSFVVLPFCIAQSAIDPSSALSVATHSRCAALRNQGTPPENTMTVTMKNMAAAAIANTSHRARNLGGVASGQLNLS